MHIQVYNTAIIIILINEYTNDIAVLSNNLIKRLIATKELHTYMFDVNSELYELLFHNVQFSLH